MRLASIRLPGDKASAIAAFSPAATLGARRARRYYPIAPPSCPGNLRIHDL